MDRCWWCNAHPKKQSYKLRLFPESLAATFKGELPWGAALGLKA